MKRKIKLTQILDDILTESEKTEYYTDKSKENSVVDIKKNIKNELGREVYEIKNIVKNIFDPTALQGKTIEQIKIELTKEIEFLKTVMDSGVDTIMGINLKNVARTIDVLYHGDLEKLAKDTYEKLKRLGTNAIPNKDKEKITNESLNGNDLNLKTKQFIKALLKKGITKVLGIDLKKVALAL